MISVITDYRGYNVRVEAEEYEFRKELKAALDTIDSRLEDEVQENKEKDAHPNFLHSPELVDEVHRRIVKETGNDWLAKGTVRYILKEVEALLSGDNKKTDTYYQELSPLVTSVWVDEVANRFNDWCRETGFPLSTTEQIKEILSIYRSILLRESGA